VLANFFNAKVPFYFYPEMSGFEEEPFFFRVPGRLPALPSRLMNCGSYDWCARSLPRYLRAAVPFYFRGGNFPDFYGFPGVLIWRTLVRLEPQLQRPHTGVF